MQPENAPAGLPELPVYVWREHDEALGQLMRAAAAGRSGVAVLSVRQRFCLRLALG